MTRALGGSALAAAHWHMNAAFAKELAASACSVGLPFDAIMETPAAKKIVNDHAIESAEIVAECISGAAVDLGCRLLEAVEQVSCRHFCKRAVQPFIFAPCHIW